MGIEITISNTNISDNSSILKNTIIKNNDDISVKLHNLDVNGQATILENLEINLVLEELDRKAQLMDKNTSEYSSIQEVLKEEQWNKKSFAKRILEHLGEFSQGVLASVIANFITSL